ncbi:hypothetical protein EB796_010249 [Bugula neritina]|uniref:Uncharacterized protein n=1 Tax=Bugula neritina TaxID=10212 RepID=A0A7J7JYG0_BUGNE|nr:hypothetical protein EB796_010249 [Bugula neritina]
MLPWILLKFILKLFIFRKCFSIQTGKVVLKLQAGLFSNVVMPETVESLWGPVPLGRLPPGVVNHCTVANHKLLVPGTFANVLCPVFLRDQMMAVSHLVGTDQIPDSQSSVIQNLSSYLYLKKSSGERAMLIKTANGDRAVLYGHWANMKKGCQVQEAEEGRLAIREIYE